MLWNMLCWIKCQTCINMNWICAVPLCSILSRPVSISQLCKWPSCILLRDSSAVPTLICPDAGLQEAIASHYCQACCRVMSWPKLPSRHAVLYLWQTNWIMHCRSHDSCHLSAQLPPVEFIILADIRSLVFCLLPVMICHGKRFLLVFLFSF